MDESESRRWWERVRSAEREELLALAAALLATLALVGALSAGFGSRIGLWHFRSGFQLLTWSAWSGLLAVVIGAGALFLSWRSKRYRVLMIALLALLAGLIVFAVPAAWRSRARAVPAIHDISTDLNQPPVFVDILSLRIGAGNPAEHGGVEVAMAQRRAYPEIRTIIYNGPADAAFQQALAAARELGWRIVAAVPGEGRIEASDRTFWFGFVDDIVIRVVPAGERSLIDIRSVSREGRSDAGTNARRIRAFAGKFAGS